MNRIIKENDDAKKAAGRKAAEAAKSAAEKAAKAAKAAGSAGSANESRKTILRLTESDLHQIVKESVNRILSEMGGNIDPHRKEMEKACSWNERNAENSHPKFSDYEPELHRNTNVYDDKGKFAMAALKNNEEDPTGASRKFGRGYKGTIDSYLKSVKK